MSALRRSVWAGVASAPQVVVLGAWTALWISLALLVAALRGDAATSLAMARRVWAPGVLAGMGIRLRVVGRQRIESLTTAVFVANHRSNLDIPVLFAALPLNLRFVLKAELAKMPFLGWYVKRMGMVLIDRDRPASARQCLAGVARLLRAGQSLVAFPEGSRRPAGDVRPFKAGVFAAAIETASPIVPVAIHGTGEAWPPGAAVGRPGSVRVEIGDPVATAGLGRGDQRELAEAVRARIRELLDRGGG